MNEWVIAGIVVVGMIIIIGGWRILSGGKRNTT